MAYDTSKLKTMKWLEKIATKERKGFHAYRPACIRCVSCRFGRFYATDNFILAQVEYAEHAGDGNDCWQFVKEYQDADGKLLHDIVLDEMENPFKDNDFFRRFIPKPTDYCNMNDAPLIDPVLVSLALEPFKYNGIDVYMAFTPEKLVISGHNRDVSILVVVMGKKSRKAQL